ncbi:MULTISPECIES: hypothetical protein [Streptomyces]|uniref:Secreted protein n=2 Tax=Streptomyces TaxID=1883 RepID=A0ABS9JF39_9ACTN|nr:MULTISPECIES: hypothetical protein [Streptomyces]MCG0064181.1 hypothetical protein [Streptomyces tricolor]BCM72785.1 hypothetical protein EASAB2608_08119 [Streptomyces sp. EAS-AB2608]
MTRTRVLTLITVAVLTAGTATAGAAAHDSGTDTAAKPKVSLRAAHGQYEGTPVTVPPGGQNIAGVSCPAGQVPTGGGSRTSAFDIYVTDSYPAGNGWTVLGKNIGTTQQTLRAVVVCTVP